jgi:lipopolysaccharide assembly outer membrane protein LptD (OstA)
MGGSTSGTNAGSYTTTFTLNKGYKWADGTRDVKNISWSIAKRSLTIPTVSGSYTYNGSSQSVTMSGYNSSTMNVTGNTKTIAILDDGRKLTLHSDYQQYNKKQNSYIGTGHVKIWFDEYYAQGPKVSVFPNTETGKPNEVYFIGRSKIVQTDRDIIADKIKITLEPKDFAAEGNVRTIIHNLDSKDLDEE